MNKKVKYGAFVISLDFELMWGCIDHKTLQNYGAEVEGVWKVIPRMLKIFEEHQIHATWGVVGLLARKNINECIENQPESLPRYTEKNLSTYEHYSEAKDWEGKYLFAGDLIEHIARTPFQEIGSHTYSHYYCVEEGQTKEDFKIDLKLACDILRKYTDDINSLIFPRNQANKDYLQVLGEYGISNYRGNEKTWFCESNSQEVNQQLLRRALRLADCYFNISGSHCYDYEEIVEESGINNIRSSRFFRPYSKRLAVLEPLRIHRIKKQMKHAAKRGQVFHLWWHPHNFGVNIGQNLKNLCEIISYYETLHKDYGMVSLNMEEIGRLVS